MVDIKQPHGESNYSNFNRKWRHSNQDVQNQALSKIM